MDGSAATPLGPPPVPPAGDTPTIGVPAIPRTGVVSRPPVPVPSVDAVPAGPDPAPDHPGHRGSTTAAPGPPPPGDVVPSLAGPGSSVDGDAASDGPVADRTAGLLEGAVPVEPGDERFAPGVADRLRSYVYLLVDPRSGRPFFAGRGKGQRCFNHVRAARDGAPDAGRFVALDRIRDVQASGREVRVELLRYGLSRAQSLLVAAAAHELLGLPGTPELPGQRARAADVGLRLAKKAKFKPDHQVVLLRWREPSGLLTYEEIRHGWRIGRRWTDTSARRSPRWAVVVVGELVGAVYRIDRWEPSSPPGGTGDGPGAGDAAPAGDRRSFVGTRDPELERRYVGRTVAAYLGRAASSQPVYVWCGPHWVNTPR